MVKDPVCGMQVDENKSAGTVNYKGQTYYFCSAACKGKFEKNPEQYMKH
jgi:YHS domain-containing protein